MSHDALGEALRRTGRRSFRLHLEASEGLRVVDGLRPIEDYADRVGYRADFIDPAMPVPLPNVGSWREDLAEVAEEARDPHDRHLLHYEHFSVKVSMSRRLPLFSAVNIDGVNEQGGIPRTDVWRYDPRIPREYQILRECYGRENLGFFSRGHMTRREDPNWGTFDQATRADSDTFHATNACPQMQGFNAGTWLRIEDHVLRNANRDNMRISVLTGPVLADGDQAVHGVRIPVSYWKLVSFVHDITGELTVTAYTASQAAFLPNDADPAFVFGQFGTYQVPVSRVERLTGLTFGDLGTRDPLAGASTQFMAALGSVDDIMLD